MKKTLLISLFAICILYVEPAYSKRVKNIESNNIYGGITREITYSSTDNEYRNGIISTMEYFDRNSLIHQIDSYFREQYANDTGIFLKKQFFNPESARKPMLIKSEFHYTVGHSDQQGLQRSEQFYDDAGTRTRAEFHFTEAWGKRKNVVKIEEYYNDKEEVYKRAYYNSKGNLISSEE